MAQQNKELDLAKLEADVKSWGTQLRGSLKSNAVQFSSDLVKSIGVRYYKTFGEVDRVSIKFARFGVYLEKGASRGHGGSKGSTWLDKDSVKHTTSAASMGKMDQGSRPARPWFNPVMDKAQPKLATIVAEHYADSYIKALQIK